MTYRIVDEPQPSPVAQVAVNPLWPLLAVMLGGVWLSWPWFVVNAVALGSPTRRREAGWAAAGVVGATAVVGAVIALIAGGMLPENRAAYGLLALTVWKLWVSYRLYLLQVRTFHLYEYFGGTVRNGILAVLVGFWLRGPVLTVIPWDIARVVAS